MYLITRHHNRVNQSLSAHKDTVVLCSPRFKESLLDLSGAVLIRTLRVVRRLLELGEYPTEYIREVVTPAVHASYLSGPEIDWSRDQALLNENFIPTCNNGVFTIMVGKVPLTFTSEGCKNVQ